MALIERVKEILKDKGMTFTDLANVMNAPRSSLYKSVQSDSIKYSTLQKIAAALNVEVVNLVTELDTNRINLLEQEVSSMLNNLDHLSRQLVRLKYSKVTMEEVQDDFDLFVRTLQKKWPNRLCSIREFEELLGLVKSESTENS
jgi:predicted transcriptional regulator